MSVERSYKLEDHARLISKHTRGHDQWAVRFNTYAKENPWEVVVYLPQRTKTGAISKRRTPYKFVGRTPELAVFHAAWAVYNCIDAGLYEDQA